MKTKRNGALDFWKFIFCMVIVVHYAYILDPQKAESASFFFYRGELAIDFFFILTGMMLARSVNDTPDGRTEIWSDTWSYLKGKFRFYLPALVICWAVGFFAVNSVCRIDTKTTVSNFFASGMELLPMQSIGFQIVPESAETVVGYRIMDQAWVFSAVIIALAICYPLYCSNRQRFEYYIAPVGGALLMGFLFFRTHILTGDKLLILDAKNKLLQFFTIGAYKALGEILAGVTCYVIVRRFSDKQLSKAKAHLLSLLEIGGYAIALCYMQFMLRLDIPKRYDFLMVGFIMISATVSLSEKSSISKLFNNPVSYFLGRFSLYPFMTFILFAKTLPYYLPDMSIRRMTAVYVGLTLLSALVLMAVEKPFVRLVKASKKLIVKPPSGKERKAA